MPNCAELRQRVMFMGKEMHNNQVLSDVKMDGAQVVQIFLRPMPK